MGADDQQRWATGIRFAAAVVFLIALLLPWHEIAVRIGGAVAVDQSATGASGWGIVGGALAVTLIGLELMRSVNDGGDARTAVTAMLGSGLVFATVIAVFTERVNVEVGTVIVREDVILWPAWLALGAALVVGLASVALVAWPRGRSRGIEKPQSGRA